MSVVDNIIQGAVESRIGEAVVKRAPFLDRPSAELERPEPGSPMAGTPSFPSPARPEPDSGVAIDTPFDTGESGDSNVGMGASYAVTSGSGRELNFSAIQPQSSADIARMVGQSQSLSGKIGHGIIGMDTIYNPATGRVTTKAPNLGAIGLPFGFLASGVATYIQKKQKEAALNAAMGKENNGVISLNGQTVAVVDGKVYGNLPEYSGGYGNLRKEIIGYVNSLDASQKSGDYYDIKQGSIGKTPVPVVGEAGRGQPAPPPPPPSRDDGDSAPAGNSYSFDSGQSFGVGSSIGGGFAGARAKGGRIGMADGGTADPVQGNGFVEGSPDKYTDAQTVADDEFRQVREGSFVLNAPTTEKLQKAGVLPKGVDNSDKNSTIKANKGGLMDVALSKGEYVIEPEEAQRIGYSFLEQLNNDGKAEVDRRQAMNQGGFAGTDLSGIPPLAAGLRSPLRTDTKPEGFVATSPEMLDAPIPRDTINGIDIDNVGRAISLVETRGYEDRNDGYFYTRSDTRSNPSSAFGPLQITGDTLAAMREESDELRIQMNEDINPGFAEYLDKFATDARNRTNYRKSGKLYTGERGKKAVGRKATPQEAEMYKNLGTGSIPLEDHKKFYPLLGKLYLRYKAGMSNSEEDMVRRHFGNTKSTQKYRDAKTELGID